MLPIALLAGCANNKPTRSGFLSAYPAGPVHQEWFATYTQTRATAGQMAPIDSFYLEAVAWRSPTPRAVAADPRQQRVLLETLADQLHQKLSPVRAFVGSPGPRTARIRAAITEDDKAIVWLNILTSLLAIPVSNGGASIELEALAPDGTQLAAVDWAQVGGPIDFLGYYFSQDHAKVAIHEAADQLAQCLSPLPLPAPAPATEPAAAAAAHPSAAER